MPTSTTSDPDDLIGGKTLAEWDKCWKPVEGGFAKRHRELRGVIGLYRGDIDNQVMCIGCATEQGKRKGLYKRLQNFLGPPQTANNHGSAHNIQENISVLTLYVLKVDAENESASVAKELKRLMKKLHSPPWDYQNKPKKSKSR